MDTFHECFGDLVDPRADNARHELVEIVFIALLATLCGATSCSDMEEFGLAKEHLLGTILTLEHGIPSHDTFSRVFRLLDPKAFEAAFAVSTGARHAVAFANGTAALHGAASAAGLASGDAGPKTPLSQRRTAPRSLGSGASDRRGRRRFVPRWCGTAVRLDVVSGGLSAGA